jgi:hypothetical protein
MRYTLISNLKNSSGMKILWILSLFLLAFSEMQAQGIQRGPQQGTVKTDKKCKIEYLGCMDHLEIYLYDSAYQAMNNSDITGRVQFFYVDKTASSSPLIHYGKEGYTAKLPPKTFVDCLVTLEIRKIVLSARFNNECVNTAVDKK